MVKENKISFDVVFAIWVIVTLASIWLTLAYPPNTGCKNACGDGAVIVDLSMDIVTCYHVSETEPNILTDEFKVLCKNQYGLDFFAEMGWLVLMGLIGFGLIANRWWDK